MRLIYADYNPYTNSIDVNTFENYILRIAAFCGLSFLLAIKITSKLSNFILHQFGGLHKLWDTLVFIFLQLRKVETNGVLYSSLLRKLKRKVGFYISFSIKNTNFLPKNN